MDFHNEIKDSPDQHSINVSTQLVIRVSRSGGELTPQAGEAKSAEMTDYIGDCITYRFMFDTIIIGCLCLLGIVGNILSIVVMQKDNSSQVATFLLQSLAIADTFVLTLSYVVLSIICGFLPFTNHQAWVGMALPYLVKYINPLGYITHSWTIWITVLIAVNRFLAITRPLTAPSMCTLSKVRLQVLAVVFLGIAFNLPRFFQYDVVFVKAPNSTMDIPQYNSTSIGDHTLFGKIYTNALYTICVLVLPLFILIFVNYKLIKEIRNARKLRESMLATPTKNSTKRANGEETNITFVMVIIVVVFLICHTPDRILQIVKVSLPQLKPSCGNTMYYLSDAVNLLIIISSSTNFVIYYFLRKRFRKILKTRICALGSSIGTPSSWSRYRTDPNELSLLPALQLNAKQPVML